MNWIETNRYHQITYIQIVQKNHINFIHFNILGFREFYSIKYQKNEQQQKKKTKKKQQTQIQMNSFPLIGLIAWNTTKMHLIIWIYYTTINDHLHDSMYRIESNRIEMPSNRINYTQTILPLPPILVSPTGGSIK